MLSNFPWFTRYSDRKLEYGISFFSVGLGLWLLAPWWTAFGDSPGHAGVNSLLSEWAWGLVFLVVGVVHTYALHINGRAAWTPFARTAALFINGLVFFNLACGFALGAPGSSGVFTYAFMAFGFCGMALYAAARDCGREIAIRRGRIIAGH